LWRGASGSEAVSEVLRSSSPSTIWRIVNLNAVKYGWNIAELRLFSDELCRADLTRPRAGSAWTAEAISSGAVSGSEASRAIDGLTWTQWTSSCHLCDPGEAWLGVKFSQPVSVLCAQLWQWGEGDYKSSKVELELWDASMAQWHGVLRGDGFASSQWETLRFVKCAALEPPESALIEVTNKGFFPSSATYSCGGVGILWGTGQRDCSPDGSWTLDAPRCLPAIEVIAFATIAVLVDLLAIALYARFVMYRKPAFLGKDSLIPSEHLARWDSSLIPHDEDDPHDLQGIVTKQCVICPCCRIADSWASAGVLPFAWGMCIQHVSFPCMPCIGAVLRSKLR
ncbi:unnamed protein product, partial [Polarella glacialis]